MPVLGNLNNVNVQNFPDPQDVNIESSGITQAVNGTVNVGNLPSTQNVQLVSGSPRGAKAIENVSLIATNTVNVQYTVPSGSYVIGNVYNNVTSNGQIDGLDVKFLDTSNGYTNSQVYLGPGTTIRLNASADLTFNGIRFED